MERDAFLSRVSAAVATTQLPDPPDIPEELPALKETDLVALFRTRAQQVNTVVHGPMPRHSVPRAVAGIAAGHGISTFGTWYDLPAPGVAAALSTDGYERVVKESTTVHEFEITPYARVDLGVTGASAALAESGSVVLKHRAGRSRLISVLPLIHVALVRVDTIFRSIAHWAHEFPDTVADTANLVVVTGPSRTGDIEQNLNLGVHGPKHVHVVLIR